jgi:hypothetical protein
MSGLYFMSDIANWNTLLKIPATTEWTNRIERETITHNKMGA